MVPDWGGGMGDESGTPAARPRVKPGRSRFDEARALAAAGDLNGAEAVFDELCRANPGRPAGWAGIARIAEEKRDWETALERWSGCIERFPDEVREGWLAGRARALHGLTRRGEAAAAFATALARYPASHAAAAGYATCLLELGDRQAAARELKDGKLRDTGSLGTALARLRLLIWLDDLAAARRSYTTAFEEAELIAHLPPLFEVVPLLFAGWHRQEAWRALERRLGGMTAGETRERAQQAILQLRLRLAMRDPAGFLSLLEGAPKLPEPWAPRFAAAARSLGTGQGPNLWATKVFGIGLPRTGTTSLTTACERLGFAGAHGRNPFTREMLKDTDICQFEAVTDLAAASQFERLYFMFPNARFVWTDRGEEDWVRGFTSHIARQHGTTDYAAFVARVCAGNILPDAADVARAHAPLFLGHADALAAYRAHADRIRRFFADKPKEKLLTHDVFVGDGWPELCRFLGRPVPEGVYPWENRQV